jgi:glycosyltransferase involved in cell wall biosynthesis
MLSDKIILPSTRAFNAVPRARLEPRSYAKINLMFADETGQQTQSLTREFISYIGTIAEDHAFDEFVRLMQGCIADQTLQPLRFLIATRSQVPKQHRAVIDQCLSTGRLVMQSGSPMSNEKINRFYAQSFVVWNAYRRSMQSGVLPKAYMFCTPVLVSTSNQSEYFQDGVHGVLISDRYSMQEFQHAIIRLVSEWSVISQNCRTYYLNNFDYRALSNMFMSFVLEKK